MTRTVIALSLCLPALYVPTFVAAQQPAFDSASIKLEDPRGPQRSHTLVHAESIDFSNVTLEQVIMRAWHIQDYQLSGPAWFRTERYTILAKAAAPASEEAILLMVQKLLADRFKLTFHHEAKLMDVYALVVVSGKRPGLQEAAPGERADGPDFTAPVARPDDHERTFKAESMPLLALMLRRYVGRPVIDTTGLNGLYNFKLPLPRFGANGAPLESDPTAPDAVPSVFVSLRERLGLKLESKKAPVDVLVIDHVERPSGD